MFEAKQAQRTKLPFHPLKCGSTGTRFLDGENIFIYNFRAQLK